MAVAVALREDSSWRWAFFVHWTTHTNQTKTPQKHGIKKSNHATRRGFTSSASCITRTNQFQSSPQNYLLYETKDFGVEIISCGLADVVTIAGL